MTNLVGPAQAEFRRVIAACTDVSKNERDSTGDGDQSPLRIIPQDGPGAHLWYKWADGGDFGAFCSFRCMPPFHAACFCGDAALVKRCIEQAKAKGPRELQVLLESRMGLMRATPLHTAVAGARTVGTPFQAQFGVPPGAAHVAVVEELIRAGARVASRDVIGATPAHYCSSVAGTPLTWGTLLPLLARAGADVDERNRYGQSPLMEPAQVGNIAAAKVLIQDLGADPHVRCNASFSPLHALDSCTDLQRKKEFKALIEAATKKQAKASRPVVASAALVGQRVKLRGLKARPELNGRVGVAEAFDDDSGRLAVLLLPPGGAAASSSSAAADTAAAERVKVKRDNIALVGVDSCAQCEAAGRHVAEAVAETGEGEGGGGGAGVAGTHSTKLRTCTSCLFVKYCGSACQKCALSQHTRYHPTSCSGLSECSLDRQTPTTPAVPRSPSPAEPTGERTSPRARRSRPRPLRSSPPMRVS